MLDLIGKRFKLFALSGIVLLVCIVTLLTAGLNMGIDFSSGSELQLRFEQEVTVEEIREELGNLGHTTAIVQVTGDDDFIIRTSTMETAEKESLLDGLAERFGTVEELSFEGVEPVIAQQTTNIAIIAIAIASVGIMLYITWAFRRMPKPFRYGACAIAALVHDVIVVLGIFAIFAIPLNLEVNLMFITGILAVIGYSVNDTVIVFDRIRENRIKNPSANFTTIVNNSLVETLTRSINTGLTTLVVILALLLFVGSTIENFSIVMFIGVVTGVYSSIFTASALLVVWENKEWKRFIPWLRKSRV